MTVVDVAGLAIAAFCAFELYRAAKTQETVIPNTSLRLSRAEQPVLFRVALGAWFILLLASIAIVGDIL